MTPTFLFPLVGCIAFCASYIQSVTGFGFGIFSMIFLPRLLQYTEANVLSSMLSGLTSLSVMLQTRRQINWKNLLFPVSGCLVATWVAVSFIKTQKNDTLTLLLGVALFALSMYFFFFSQKIKIRPTWYAGLLAGILSGLMGGMFSIGGPPVVIYFMQSEEDPQHYFSTISCYFVFSGSISIVSKAFAGFITLPVMIGLAFGLVGMLIGSYVGKRTREKTNPKAIKKAVYGFMAVSGIVNIVTSLL